MSGKPQPECRNGHRRTTENTRQRISASNGKPYQACIVCEQDASRRGHRRAKERAKEGRARTPLKRRGRAAAQEQLERLLNGPDTQYKQAMLEALAEFQAWEAKAAQRARRGRAA